MTAVKWLEVHVDTNHTGLEPVETMLSAHGIDGVVIDDEAEFEDFLENNHQYWDYVDEDLRQEMQGRSRITFYLEAGDEGFAKLGEVRIALEELKKTMDPKKYVGRAPQQVEEFLDEVIRPVLEENKDLLGVKAEINV